MPFTPFHLGPALFFGLIFLGHLNFTTFVIANVIVDIEPLLVIMFDLNYPLHGFFHSFIGSFILGFSFSFLMFVIYSYIHMFRRLFLLDHGCTSFGCFIFSGVLGVFLHVLLDSPLYTDIKPFYPFDVNPFYCPSLASTIYLLCIAMFLISFVLYFIRRF